MRHWNNGRKTGGLIREESIETGKILILYGTKSGQKEAGSFLLFSEFFTCSVRRKEKSAPAYLDEACSFQIKDSPLHCPFGKASVAGYSWHGRETGALFPGAVCQVKINHNGPAGQFTPVYVFCKSVYLQDVGG